MKSYYNKAKDYTITSRSVRTKHYEELKKQAEEEKRTALEFCIWYDFQLVDKAKLDTGVFSCILDLVNNKHITAPYVKQFRLACILLQRFLQSSKATNDKSCQEYIADHPEVASILETKRINMDFSQFLNYDRAKAHKQLFPFFRSKGINTDLVAELISRHLLAYDLDRRNLIFLNRTDRDTIGVEKLGTGTKHFQRLEGTMPMCWHYWLEQDEHITFRADIDTVIFFDTTLNMLKYLTDNEPQERTLYASLHTPNCLLETYKNTLALLRLDVKIEYVFEDELKTRRFKLFNLMPDESMFLPKLATPAPEPTAAEAPTVEVEATATADDDDEDLPF